MSTSRHPATRDSKRDGESGRSAIEKELADKEASIHRRIDELENEIVSTPAAIKASITKHPFLGVAGAVAAGLAVGLLATRRRKPAPAPFHQRLVEEYIDAVGDDVRQRMSRGRTAKEAVREALEDRAPLVIYAPTRTVERDSRSFLSEIGDIVLKTALGFAVKMALDVAAAAVDVEELQEMIAPEEEAEAPHTGDGAAGAVDHAADVP